MIRNYERIYLFFYYCVHNNRGDDFVAVELLFGIKSEYKISTLVVIEPINCAARLKLCAKTHKFLCWMMQWGWKYINIYFWKKTLLFMSRSTYIYVHIIMALYWRYEWHKSHDFLRTLIFYYTFNLDGWMNGNGFAKSFLQWGI